MWTRIAQALGMLLQATEDKKVITHRPDATEKNKRMKAKEYC